jgi:hypothetical protein
MSRPIEPAYYGATLGLRLGLMTGFLAIGIPPLIRFYVAYRLNANTDDILYELPFDVWSILNGVFGVLILLAVFITWRGRPPQMRLWFQGVLLATLGVIIIEAANRYFYECETCVISPANELLNEVFRWLIPLQILVVLYNVWYFNREPAREFFDQFKHKEET